LDSSASTNTRNIQILRSSISYAFNRRFSLQLRNDYEWLNRRRNNDESGDSFSPDAQFELIDTPSVKYAFHFRVITPDDSIGNKLTTLAPALAGWYDLSNLGLDRTSFYYSAQDKEFVGPANSGTRRNAFVGTVSLAKAWTRANPSGFGHFMTFVDVVDSYAIDGDVTDRNLVVVRPGLRINLWGNSVLMGAIDFPVVTTTNEDAVYRLAYIFNF
jgi:hypothetical protein